jgi:soluble lytic murein transglycosylase-like protein
VSFTPGGHVDSLVEENANIHKLNKSLIYAVIQVESSGDPWSIRYEPQYKWVLPRAVSLLHAKAWGVSIETEEMAQKTSWGLMQVMGGVARELGYDEPLTKLLLPEFGIEYGCKQLARLSKKYKKDSELIASYNAGSPRKDDRGRFLNQSYVDKVTTFIENYKKVGIV